MSESASPITVKLLGFGSVAVLLGWLSSTGLSAQDTDAAKIVLSDGDPAAVKVGAEHVEAGETRYPLRKAIGNQGAVIEFSHFPETSSRHGRSPPPRLSDLIGNPAQQAALNEAAKPGDWVTPPAANR